jgi:hypothetical protein
MNDRKRAGPRAIVHPKLALRHDGRRRCFSLANRVLAFARATGNAQCQCQRTNDSEELIHDNRTPQ